MLVQKTYSHKIIQVFAVGRLFHVIYQPECDYSVANIDTTLAIY
jgi:hypothetical protein